MGQAKLRGTYDERVSAAKEREAAEAREWQRRQNEQRQVEIVRRQVEAEANHDIDARRKGNARASRRIAIAAAMAMSGIGMVR